VISRITSSRKVIGMSVVGFALAAGVTSATANIAAAEPVSVAATNTMRACVKKTTGVVRYEASATKDCRSTESLITWNRRGVPGARGALGAKGLPGLVGEKGDVGETGAVGPIGPIGLTGPAGATGATGATGSSGSSGFPGPPGAAGATVLSGSAVPVAEGVNGDFYIRTGATPTIYGPKTSGAWGSATSLTGAAGPSMVTGTTVPADLTDGANGDYYLRTGTVPSLYGPKTSNAWGAAKLLGVAGYERVSGSLQASSSTATCNSGKKVVGGGFTSSLDPTDAVIQSAATSDTVWTASLRNTSGNALVIAYAICLTM
jgi:collagen triple helix repeat protein